MSEQKKNYHVVTRVCPNSIAEKNGILEGDELVSINGERIVDIFDYRYDIICSHVDLVIRRDGNEMTVSMDKDEEDDLGLEFTEGLMDEYRRCRNACIFCFIDQMPPGMRETLYFKDDDSRLSFLQGNYVTLTNLSENDVERIIRFRMSPINISFQTTNPELRCKMLNNRFAGECLKIVDRFYEEGITMNGQIVLCKDINDGEELKRTIEDLGKYAPVLESVSIVPVGLTKYREGLYPLKPFTKEDAVKVIDMIESFQRRFYESFGLHFVHASDEWYILAGREMPEEDRYDGYLQLDNGVGMMRLLNDEFVAAFDKYAITGLKKKFMKRSECVLVTGVLAYPMLKKFADMVNNEYPRVNVSVISIKNEFFGETITVSGLITGQDIVKQLKGKVEGKRILLPQNMLRADENIFLDDMKLDELSKTLQVQVDIVKSSGRDLLLKMLNQ